MSIHFDDVEQKVLHSGDSIDIKRSKKWVYSDESYFREDSDIPLFEKGDVYIEGRDLYFRQDESYPYGTLAIVFADHDKNGRQVKMYLSVFNDCFTRLSDNDEG